MRLNRPIHKVLITLFIIGWLLMLPGGFFSQRNNKDYAALQAQTYTVEVIETVLTHEDRIYVCYSGGSIVNAYDQAGNFQWCVSAPYMRNCKFHILDDTLVIYHYSDSPAYRYDVLTGSFLSCAPANTLNLPFGDAGSTVDLDALLPGQIGHDAFNVYRAEENGHLAKIVSRPIWYWLFHPIFAWAVCFGSGMCYTFLYLWEQVRENSYSNNQGFSRKVRWVVTYEKFFTAIHVIQIILNIFLLPRYLMYILTTFGLCAVFILSGWVLAFIKTRLACTDEEQKAINKWHALYVGTFLAVFILLIITLLLFV